MKNSLGRRLALGLGLVVAVKHDKNVGMVYDHLTIEHIRAVIKIVRGRAVVKLVRVRVIELARIRVATGLTRVHVRINLVHDHVAGKVARLIVTVIARVKDLGHVRSNHIVVVVNLDPTLMFP